MERRVHVVTSQLKGEMNGMINKAVTKETNQTATTLLPPP